MSDEAFIQYLAACPRVGPKQFFGIELDHFGAELTKVTLMLAKKLAFDEARRALDDAAVEVEAGLDGALPLDNLDGNILNIDALFSPWPEVDAIVGNPPFQSKNKLQEEYGREYVNRVRERYPEVKGNADYCVYWIRLAHNHLKAGQRAGLVGTNTIRQNYSRESGLDHVVDNGGVITDAVSSMIWSGEANLHISVVNWVKGEAPGMKRLSIQVGNKVDEGWSHVEVPRIGASLSFELDVTKAQRLEANAARGGCFQGQTHGHEGFLLEPVVAKAMIAKDASYGDVLFPFLIADDLIGAADARPSRYVIDFQSRSLLEAQQFPSAFKPVTRLVLPDRETAADDEATANAALRAKNPRARVNQHHANFLKHWWRLSWRREEMLDSISKLPRYITCGCVTKRPIFEFISSDIHPNAALQVFPYADDYSFGILQSSLHWAWFTARCSTLTERPRYTSNTVFDSFAWPQRPTLGAVRSVADAAVALRKVRATLKTKHKLSLRDLYRSIDLPGEHPLKAAQGALDGAVRNAYGMKSTADPLAFLLSLNQELHAEEAEGVAIQGPGLPPIITKASAFVTKDAVQP